MWCLFNWKYKFSCRILSNIANYVKYNYFWDVDGIDNVTLRKFSDFCSRHIVGVAGDGIMYHILVDFVCGLNNYSRVIQYISDCGWKRPIFRAMQCFILYKPFSLNKRKCTINSFVFTIKCTGMQRYSKEFVSHMQKVRILHWDIPEMHRPTSARWLQMTWDQISVKPSTSPWSRLWL